MKKAPVYFDGFTRIGKIDGAHPAEHWSLEHLRDEMELCGIGAALVSGQGDEYSNERLYAELAEEPGLYPMWTLAPDSDASGIQTRAVTSALLPDAAQARQLAGSGLLLVLSASDFEDFWAVSGFCEANPDLNILLHDIHFSRTHELPKLLRSTLNLHVTLTQANWFIEHFVELGFESRILFASGTPKRSAGSMRAIIDWGDIPNGAAQKIAGGNLARLLGVAMPKEIEESSGSLVASAQKGEPLPCRVLDMHAHILEEGMDGHETLEMLNGGPIGTRELGRRIGIDGVATMSWVGIMDLDTDAGNGHIREAIEYAPDFFRGLPTFDIREKPAAEIRAEMKREFSDPRMVGVKPYYTFGVPFDDPRYDPVWEFAQERGVYVGIHPTTFQMPNPEYKADEFESLCSRYPNLKVLAYHAGCSFEIADTVIGLCRKYSTIYAEINYSSVPGGMIEYLVEGCGAGRVLFGTDQVMRDPRPQLGWLVYSRLDESIKRQLLGGNAGIFFAER